MIELDAITIQFIIQGTMRMILIMDTAAIYYGDSGMRPGRLKWSVLATDAGRYVDGRCIIQSYLYCIFRHLYEYTYICMCTRNYRL